MLDCWLLPRTRRTPVECGLASLCWVCCTCTWPSLLLGVAVSASRARARASGHPVLSRRAHGAGRGGAGRSGGLSSRAAWADGRRGGASARLLCLSLLCYCAVASETGWTVSVARRRCLSLTAGNAIVVCWAGSLEPWVSHPFFMGDSDNCTCLAVHRGGVHCGFWVTAGFVP